MYSSTKWIALNNRCKETGYRKVGSEGSYDGSWLTVTVLEEKYMWGRLSKPNIRAKY